MWTTNCIPTSRGSDAEIFPTQGGRNSGGGALDEYCLWLASYGMAASSIRLYRTHLERLGRTCDLATASVDDLVNFLSTAGWKPNTRRSMRSAFRSYYGWAVRTGRRPDDPTLDIRAVRVPPQERVIPTEEALEAALLAASPVDELALLLAAYAGMRRAEIADLHVSDVHDGFIHVRGKGGKVRKVPIHPRLAEPLGEAVSRGGYVFPGSNGWDAITPDAMGKRLSRAMGSQLTAHSLRRYFATTVYRNSRDVKAVQQLLGHSSLATTSIYLGADEAQLVAAVATLAPGRRRAAATVEVPEVEMMETEPRGRHAKPAPV